MIKPFPVADIKRYQCTYVTFSAVNDVKPSVGGHCLLPKLCYMDVEFLFHIKYIVKNIYVNALGEYQSNSVFM